MSRARPNPLEYGKGEFSGGGADVRGAGGGGGTLPRTPGQARAQRLRSAPAPREPIREESIKRTKKLIDESTTPSHPIVDDIDKQLAAEQRRRYLQGVGGMNFRKGGFIEDFASGFSMGQQSGVGKKKRKDDEELFPDAPGGGLYRKGGMVKGRDYGKKGSR